MKKYVLFAFIALFFVPSSAWANMAYVKLTAEDGTVSWIEIYGSINGTNIDISNGYKFSAIDSNTKGSIDLNEVWYRSGGRGIHYQVTSIGLDAFYNCKGLTSVDIPSSVTSIGDYAFYGCSNLTSITIPNSVTSIGMAVFSYSGLKSVSIGNGVTSIGQGSFGYVCDLTSIVVEPGNSVYDSRNNCNAIIKTESNELVFGCVNTIIPSSVTSIGDYAFYGCSGLISITSYITEVFETGRNSFIGCENATLYVPKGLVSTYRSTVDWDLFNKIEEIPGIALAMSCNNKGKVTVNGGIQFTNDMGEVSVYDGMDNSFIFQPKENCELRQVLIDGLDVTVSVENNQLTTKVHEGSKMMVIFDKTGYDVNGDGNVDISDVVKLVNFILGQ